ncbi:c-type cytochrome [Gluconacetobacter sp. 1b LMG 1731]|uniref:C-type cytochrome n=1 Tax=Gluconacetobacter dulcium TaxID=2729096 RepID=A0A7W4NR94_9PROT|nr:cytochrome c [Gluconacetobacter dulcium]MBB2163364.1 c-type cytochrome [Gluconacetobacter dulcium]MBB2192519.1 c-type cytochrome [Gluconacetobacter dulcium]
MSRAFVMRFGRRVAGAAVLAGIVLAGTAQAQDADLVRRGAYLEQAADCEVCHTKPGGVPFAGGRAFDLPGIGTLYAPNITPDAETGIGRYTDAQFDSAVRRGVGPGWRHLYPVMPYASYAKMTAEDVRAIRAYLMSLRPVHAPAPANQVRFPYNIRLAMIGWNLLYRPSGPLPDDPARTAAWNRGRYLVEAAGHCGECHTPRTMLQALSMTKSYAGAMIDGWLAYNISSDVDSGIGAWSDTQLAAYLSTGHADGRGTAVGPMADVVSHSLRFLTPEDVAAMVTYLRSLPARRSDETIGVVSPETLAQLAPIHSNGERLFAGACTGCHLTDGHGRQVDFAALWGARSLGEIDGRNLVRTMVEGGTLQTAHGAMVMPAFGPEYRNQDLADIANYAISHFGNREGHVTARDVAVARGGVSP